jgi:hypothetical protein
MNSIYPWDSLIVDVFQITENNIFIHTTNSKGIFLNCNLPINCTGFVTNFTTNIGSYSLIGPDLFQITLFSSLNFKTAVNFYSIDYDLQQLTILNVDYLDVFFSDCTSSYNFDYLLADSFYNSMIYYEDWTNQTNFITLNGPGSLIVSDKPFNLICQNYIMLISITNSYLYYINSSSIDPNNAIRVINNEITVNYNDLFFGACYKDLLILCTQNECEYIHILKTNATWGIIETFGEIILQNGVTVNNLYFGIFFVNGQGITGYTPTLSYDQSLFEIPSNTYPLPGNSLFESEGNTDIGCSSQTIPITINTKTAVVYAFTNIITTDSGSMGYSTLWLFNKTIFVIADPYDNYTTGVVEILYCNPKEVYYCNNVQVLKPPLITNYTMGYGFGLSMTNWISNINSTTNSNEYLVISAPYIGNVYFYQCQIQPTVICNGPVFILTSHLEVNPDLFGFSMSIFYWESLNENWLFISNPSYNDLNGAIEIYKINKNDELTFSESLEPPSGYFFINGSIGYGQTIEAFSINENYMGLIVSSILNNEIVRYVTGGDIMNFQIQGIVKSLVENDHDTYYISNTINSNEMQQILYRENYRIIYRWDNSGAGEVRLNENANSTLFGMKPYKNNFAFPSLNQVISESLNLLTLNKIINFKRDKYFIHQTTCLPKDLLYLQNYNDYEICNNDENYRNIPVISIIDALSPYYYVNTGRISDLSTIGLVNYLNNLTNFNILDNNFITALFSIESIYWINPEIRNNISYIEPRTIFVTCPTLTLSYEQSNCINNINDIVPIWGFSGPIIKCRDLLNQIHNCGCCPIIKKDLTELTYFLGDIGNFSQILKNFINYWNQILTTTL